MDLSDLFLKLNFLFLIGRGIGYLFVMYDGILFD